MRKTNPAFFRPLSTVARAITALVMASGWIISAVPGLFLSTPAISSIERQRLVLAGATLIDGVGNAPVNESRIVIVDGRFACISGPDGCAAFPDDHRIDVSGTWITPGLIDTHVHLQPETDAETMAEDQALRFALGITTVRDGGSQQLEALLDERKRASAPDLPIPRIVISARPLEMYAERYGVKLGTELVRHLVERGVDAIKIKDHTSTDLWAQEVRTASKLGVPVWGHTYDSIGPPPVSITAPALAAGLDGIAHLSWVAPFCQLPGHEVTPKPEKMEVHEWRKSYWMTTDPVCIDTLIKDVVRAGVWLEPTLVTEWYWWGRDLKPPRRFAFLRKQPPSLVDMLTGRDALAERTPATFPKFFPKLADFVHRFHEAGGMLITGADNLRPGLDIHAEMELFREAGLTPIASLQAATRNAAIALGRQDLGTIEVGKLADAVIYASDPLDPVGTTLSVLEVIKGGVVHASAPLLDDFQIRYRDAVRLLWLKRVLWLMGALAVAAVVGIWTFRRLFR